MDFKISLAACRTNAGKTQREWAKDLGVSLNTINNWEAGKTKPDACQLIKISELSKVPMDFIFVPKQS